jgi:hypothetical protein
MQSGLQICGPTQTSNVPIPGQSDYSASPVQPTTKIGSNQVTVYARDVAGNNATTQPTVNYSVQYAGSNISCGPSGYQSMSRAFLDPVGPDAGATVKKGRSVPFKFRVCDANGVSIGASGPVIASISVQMVGAADGDTPEDIADAVEDTNFHWDATNQFWIYNLRTRDKERNFKYIYTLTLNDGTTLIFWIKVK